MSTVGVDSAFMPRQLQKLDLAHGCLLLKSFHDLPKGLNFISAICVNDAVDQLDFDNHMMTLRRLPLENLTLRFGHAQNTPVTYTLKNNILYNLPRSLRKLDLIGIRFDEPDNWVPNIPPSLDSLRITVHGNVFVHDDQISQLPRTLKHLQCAEIPSVPLVQTLTVRSLVQYPPYLLTLDIPGGDFVTDQNLALLPPSLTSINFKQSKLSAKCLVPGNYTLFGKLRHFGLIERKNCRWVDNMLQFFPSLSAIPDDYFVHSQCFPFLNRQLHSLCINTTHVAENEMKHLPPSITDLKFLVNKHSKTLLHESCFVHLPKRLKNLTIQLSSLKNKNWHQLPRTLSKLVLNILPPQATPSAFFMSIDESLISKGPQCLTELIVISKIACVGTAEFWASKNQHRPHLATGSILKPLFE
jgi:hypothetical protein